MKEQISTEDFYFKEQTIHNINEFIRRKLINKDSGEELIEKINSSEIDYIEANNKEIVFLLKERLKALEGLRDDEDISIKDNTKIISLIQRIKSFLRGVEKFK